MYEKFLKQITDFIFIDQEPQKADIIFIPGNGFPNPSERAAELYREEFAKKLLPSGHYSVVLGHFAGVLQKQELYQGKFETEWEFLQQVLVQNGVDKKDILKEDNATYTYENAIYSKKVTDKEGMEVKKAIMKAAEKVYVLADSSKFGGGYLSVICPTNEVYKIITDDGVSKENVSKAKELGVPLVVA